MAAFGDAVGLVARSEVRSRWRALLGLALLIALVGTVALSAFAGARRTASALDRFVDTTQARDARISPPSGDTAEALERDLEAESWVSTAAVKSLLAFATGADVLFVSASPDADFGTTVDRPFVVEGRLPLPGTTNEIAVNEQAAREGLSPGDTIEIQTFDPGNFTCAIERTCVLEVPASPTEQLVVTGVYRSITDLVSKDLSPEAVGPTSFHDEYIGRTGNFGDEVLVRLAEGSQDLRRLAAFVDSRGEGATGLGAGTDFLDYPQDAVDVAGTGLLVFTLVSGLAGCLLLAQAISRYVAAGTEHYRRLRELGLTRRQQAMTTALPVTGSALAGVAVAVVLAAPTSGWYPFGAVADMEPDPGFRFDPVGLGSGAFVLVMTTMVWATWRAWRATGLDHRRHAARPSALAHVLARLGADPALIGGARLAFDRRPSDGSSMMRSALLATTVGVIGVVGIGTVLVSLDDLVAAPDEWGWGWDAVATALDPATVEQTAAELPDEDGVAGAAVYRLGDVELDDVVVTGHSLDAVTRISHTLVEGDLPDEPDEVALGTITRRELDVDIGDTVTATDLDGDDVDLEVVGTVLLPTFVDRDPGHGALLGAEAWPQLASRTSPPQLVVRFDEGVDRSAVQDRLLQTRSLGFQEPTLPFRLENLDRVRGIGPALVAFFAVLTFFGLLHALVTAVRERRAMLAMLRLLGSRRSHIRHAVLWQAAFVAGASLLVGLPIGVGVGRWTWSRLVEDLGVVAAPQVELTTLVLVVPVAFGLAVLAALIPAWVAARQRIAAALQPA